MKIEGVPYKTVNWNGIPAEEHKGERGAALGLSREQLALLADLLAGRPPATGSDLLVDEINARLFDLLGDTAVEFDEAGRPALVPDYVYDVSQATGLSAP